MNQLLNWLGGGDLTSDGDSNQVADLVIEIPALLDDLIEGLRSENDVVRGRAADAVEKVAWHRPQNVARYLPMVLQHAEHDPIPMVR
jgi:HEAT repeat protein